MNTCKLNKIMIHRHNTAHKLYKQKLIQLNNYKKNNKQIILCNKTINL